MTIAVSRLLILMFLLGAAPAFAYLDPSTGSAIFQGILAAIAGVAIAGKSIRYKITSFFRKTSPAKDAEPEQPE